MSEKSQESKFIKVVCPRCGKAIPMRILSLEGTLRYSIHCRQCKEMSIVELNKAAEE